LAGSGAWTGIAGVIVPKEMGKGKIDLSRGLLKLVGGRLHRVMIVVAALPGVCCYPVESTLWSHAG